MANLFDLISAEINTKKRDLDNSAMASFAQRSYGRSVFRRPGYKGQDTCKRKTSTAREHLPKKALRGVGKNDNMAKFDYLQRMTSSFVIPKKKDENKGLLIDVPLTSREWHREVLPMLVKSYWHQMSSSAFSYDTVLSVHNTKLLNQYLGRRRELRLEGYSEKEVMDSYGFLYVPSLQEVEKICQDGLHVGNCAVSSVGHPDMGVQVCRYSDVFHQQPLQLGQTGYIIIFKIIKGKIKLVSENRGSVYLEPTPNFDCHMIKSNSDMVSDSRRYEQNQMYLYEYGEMDVVSQPRHICPVFVVRFTCTKMVNPDIRPGDKVVTIVPTGRQSSHKPLLSRSSSLPAYQFSPAHLAFHSAPYTAKKQSLLNTSSSSKTCRQPENSESIGTIVWQGDISVKGYLPCPVELSSLSTNLKPAILGNRIHLKYAMKLEDAKTKFLSQIKLLRKNAEILKNKNLYSVCYLKPKGDNSVFRGVLHHLKKCNKAGVVKLEGNTEIIIVPDGKFTTDLGISVVHGSAEHLCCIFISPKSRRRAIRSVRLTRNPEKYNFEEIVRVPLTDTCLDQLVSHSVWWGRVECETFRQADSVVLDYDLGFLPSCPTGNLVQPHILRNLFVEQIVIQRQHDCITETLHLPSKLYVESHSSALSRKNKEFATVDKKCISDLYGSQTGAEDSCVFKTKLILNTTTSTDQSPVILSPDTTFDDTDIIGILPSEPGQSRVTVDNTPEGFVSSTVSDSAVPPARLTDELAEQIVRAFRIPATQLLSSDSAKDLNPRDPRKRKHQPVEVPGNSSNGFSQEHSHGKVRHFEDSFAFPDAIMVPEMAKSEVSSNPEKFEDTDCGKFSPEMEDNEEDQTDVLAEPVGKETEMEPEVDEINTAQDMKKLLDSGLDNSNSKESDLSDDEIDFEPPSLEEISDALDQRLLFASQRNVTNSESDKTKCSVNQSFKPSCNILVTITNSKGNTTDSPSSKANEAGSGVSHLNNVKREKSSVSKRKGSIISTFGKTFRSVPSVNKIKRNAQHVIIPDSSKIVKRHSKSSSRSAKLKENKSSNINDETGVEIQRDNSSKDDVKCQEKLGNVLVNKDTSIRIESSKMAHLKKQTLSNKNHRKTDMDKRKRNNSTAACCLLENAEPNQVDCDFKSANLKSFSDLRNGPPKECTLEFLKLENDMLGSKITDLTFVEAINQSNNSERETVPSASDVEELNKLNDKSSLKKANSDSKLIEIVCSETSNSTKLVQKSPGNVALIIPSPQENFTAEVTKNAVDVKLTKHDDLQTPVSDKMKTTVETALRKEEIKCKKVTDLNSTTNAEKSFERETPFLGIDTSITEENRKQNLWDELSPLMEIGEEKDTIMNHMFNDAEEIQKGNKACNQQRMFLSDRFPGSSCSKTIPAGFFGDSEHLVQRSHSVESQDVMFEEDVVVSELIGNQTTTTLLVFLTNVAQKYKHFVGDYFIQAGLEHIIPLTNEFTERQISMGILYSDMSVTITNNCQGQQSESIVDLQTCVSVVLHGQQSLTDNMAVDDVVKLVTSVIHCQDHGHGPDRLVTAPDDDKLTDSESNTHGHFSEINLKCPPENPQHLKSEPLGSTGSECTASKSQMSDAIQDDKKVSEGPTRSDSCIESVKDIPLPGMISDKQKATVSQAENETRTTSLAATNVLDIDSVKDIPLPRMISDKQKTTVSWAENETRTTSLAENETRTTSLAENETRTSSLTVPVVSDNSQIQRAGQKPDFQRIHKSGYLCRPGKTADQELSTHGLAPELTGAQINTKVTMMHSNENDRVKHGQSLNVYRSADFKIPIIPLEPVKTLNNINKPIVTVETFKTLNQLKESLIPRETVEEVNYLNRPPIPVGIFESLNLLNKPSMLLENDQKRPLEPKALEHVWSLIQGNTEHRTMRTDKLAEDSSLGLQTSASIIRASAPCQYQTVHSITPATAPCRYQTVHSIIRASAPCQYQTVHSITRATAPCRYQTVHPGIPSNLNHYHTSAPAIENLNSDSSKYQIYYHSNNNNKNLGQTNCGSTAEVKDSAMELKINFHENPPKITKMQQMLSQNYLQSQSPASCVPYYPPLNKSVSNKESPFRRTVQYSDHPMHTFSKEVELVGVMTGSLATISKENQLFMGKKTCHFRFENEQTTELEFQNSNTSVSNKESSESDLYDPFELAFSPESPNKLINSNEAIQKSSKKEVISDIKHKDSSRSGHKVLSSSSNCGLLKPGCLPFPRKSCSILHSAKNNSVVSYPAKDLSIKYFATNGSPTNLCTNDLIDVEKQGTGRGSELYDPFELEDTPVTKTSLESDDLGTRVDAPITERLPWKTGIIDTKCDRNSIDNGVPGQNMTPNFNKPVHLCVIPKNIKKISLDKNTDLHNPCDVACDPLTHSMTISSIESKETREHLNTVTDDIGFKRYGSKLCPISKCCVKTFRTTDFSSGNVLKRDLLNSAIPNLGSTVEVCGNREQSGSTNLAKLTKQYNSIHTKAELVNSAIPYLGSTVEVCGNIEQSGSTNLTKLTKQYHSINTKGKRTRWSSAWDKTDSTSVDTVVDNFETSVDGKVVKAKVSAAELFSPTVADKETKTLPKGRFVQSFQNLLEEKGSPSKTLSRPINFLAPTKGQMSPKPTCKPELNMNSGGIFIPDDQFVIGSSPDDLENFLQRLVKLQENGNLWSIKVHSQQVCKLATKRHIFKPNTEAHENASKTLKLLTTYMKLGVVELLKEHQCDLCLSFDPLRHVECAIQLGKNYSRRGHQTVILLGSGTYDEDVKKLTRGTTVNTFTMYQLLQFF